jgi:hypothetical protein
VRALVYATVMLAACDGATPEPGYGAALQLAGAQFREGPFPAASGGPPTQLFVSSHATVEIGTIRERLHAVLDPDARAAIAGVAGQDGAWIIVAGPPDIDTPGQPTATARFGLDRGVEPGPFTLVLAATDADGRVGEPASVGLVADAVPPPDGDLVVGLVWDSTADLDLHVVDPTGNEAWSGKPNTMPPPKPGTAVDPDAYLTYGILDRDGNAGCHVDNPPMEHVIWKARTNSLGQPTTPVIPSGTYTVRVDTRSLCKDASAAWYVEVYAQGTLLAAARGVSAPDDVRGDHSYGAGVTALTFSR